MIGTPLQKAYPAEHAELQEAIYREHLLISQFAPGSKVFPSNFIPDLDFSVIETEEQLDQVIRRDFETKAPSGTEIGLRIEQRKYKDRVALMRDVALNLFWVNRFAMTMYDKVPTRWRDVPRSRSDVYLPVVQPWLDKESKVSAVETAFNELPSGGDPETEDRIWGLLFDVFGNRKHHASALEAILSLRMTSKSLRDLDDASTDRALSRLLTVARVRDEGGVWFDSCAWLVTARRP